MFILENLCYFMLFSKKKMLSLKFHTYKISFFMPSGRPDTYTLIIHVTDYTQE